MMSRLPGAQPLCGLEVTETLASTGKNRAAQDARDPSTGVTTCCQNTGSSISRTHLHHHHARDSTANKK